MDYYNYIYNVAKFFLLISTFISAHFVYLSYRKILPLRHSPVFSCIFFHVITNTVSYFITIYSPDTVFSKILIILFFLFMISFLYKGNYLHIFLILFLNAAIPSMMEILMLSILKISHFEIHMDSEAILLLTSFSFPFILFFTYKLTVFIFKSIAIFPSQFLMLILFYVVDLYFLSFISTTNLMSGSADLYILLLFILNFTFLIVSGFLFRSLYHIFYDTYQSKHLERENKLLNEQYNLLKKEETKNRKLRHDIGNHLLTIDILLKSGDKASAQQYYEDVKKQHK